VSLPGRSRLAILAFLALAPIAGLSGLDLAIEHATPFWSWVLAKFPRRIDDSFLAEALVRATPRGRENVVLIGNSRADDGVDLAALETRFWGRGLHFRNMTVVGSGPVDEAMRARDLASLAPSTVIAVLGPDELRESSDYARSTFAYDAIAARHIFVWRELWADPEFHLTGLAGQLHVLARHRRSFQNAAMVQLGAQSFRQIELDMVAMAREMEEQHGQRRAFVEWVKKLEPDTYPNDNTRSLEWLADSLHAAGARLVVVEAPGHLMLQAPRAQPRVERFRGYVAELAAQHDFVFVPGSRFPELQLDQFKDLVHVNESGRATYTETLERELDAIL